MIVLEAEFFDKNLGWVVILCYDNRVKKKCSKATAKVVIPFRYPGGKYYAIKKIRPFIAAVEHDEYREPFFGGGAVFWAKDKAKYNWINDKETGLIQTLQFFQNQKGLGALLELFAGEKEATKEKYEEVKALEPKNNLEKAYKFYYLNRTSFSGKMRNPSWGYRPKRSLPPYRWKERIIPCSKKLQDVKITCLDFEKVIDAPAEHGKVLLFLDPPYFAVDQKSHYICTFEKEDHQRLCECLKKTKHQFILTYDDCPEVRKMYKWANIYDLKFFYRVEAAIDHKRKEGNEIIITNFEVAQ